MNSKNLPGDVIGYRKDGRPIRLIAGGAPDDPEVVATPPEDIFANPAVKAAIEKARQEEKDKLYGRIGKQDDRFKALEDELAKVRKTEEDRLTIEKQKADEAAAKVEAKRKEEVSAKTLLDEQTARFDAQIAAIQQERESERALLAKEREFLELREYAQARLGAAADDIAPELLDYVTGNSREEIDASIDRAKEKTQAILESVQASQQNGRQFDRGVSVAGYSTTGPLDTEPITQQYTAEQLKKMSMDKFAELRGKLGIGSDSRGSNRGLFG